MTRQIRPEVPAEPTSNQRRWIWMLASAAAVVGVALACRQFGGTAEAEARAPAKQDANVQPASATKPYTPPEHDVMAIVNGEDISRKDLEEACVERFGEQVLESITNKKLILHHCKKARHHDHARRSRS